jgi:hypothetical protein
MKKIVQLTFLCKKKMKKIERCNNTQNQNQPAGSRLIKIWRGQSESRETKGNDRKQARKQEAN